MVKQSLSKEKLINHEAIKLIGKRQLELELQRISDLYERWRQTYSSNKFTSDERKNYLGMFTDQLKNEIVDYQTSLDSTSLSEYESILTMRLLGTRFLMPDRETRFYDEAVSAILRGRLLGAKQALHDIRSGIYHKHFLDDITVFPDWMLPPAIERNQLPIEPASEITTAEAGPSPLEKQTRTNELHLAIEKIYLGQQRIRPDKMSARDIFKAVEDFANGIEGRDLDLLPTFSPVVSRALHGYSSA